MRTECHAHPVPSGSAAPEGRPGQSRGLCLGVPWSGGEGLAAPSVSVHVCSPDSKLSKILKVLLQHRCQVYTPTHPSLQGPQSQESLLQEGLWDTGPWWRDIRQLEGALGRDEVVPLLCHGIRRKHPFLSIYVRDTHTFYYDYFRAGFRFTAELRGRYGDFLCTPCTHRHSPPTIDISPRWDVCYSR